MPQTRKEIVFTDADMTAPLSWEFKLNANFGFLLQWWWTGLTGSSEVRVYSSTQKGGPWIQKVLMDKKCKCILSIPITAASDSDGIEANNFRGDYIRVEVDAATSGTINAVIDMSENGRVSG